jgi:hypothetical protein
MGVTELYRCRLLAQHPKSLTSEDHCGGVMRIGRAIVIPVMLTLGVAGASLAGSAAPAAAAQLSNVHVVAVGSIAKTGVLCHS